MRGCQLRANRRLAADFHYFFAQRAHLLTGRTRRSIFSTTRAHGGFSIELNYDVDVTVVSAGGVTLATKRFDGVEKSKFQASTVYGEIEKAHKKRVEAILTDPAIASAL